MQTHAQYALSQNWLQKTRPTLVALLPVPQRYFLPNRIRQSYKARLEAAELWDAAGVQQEEEEERAHFTFRKSAKKNRKAQDEKKKKHQFARERVIPSCSAVCLRTSPT